MKNEKKKKVLYIVQHRFDRSPGQRYRCEQYIRYLEQHGFECTYSPIIVNEQEDRELYFSTSKIRKAKIFFKALFRRMRDSIRAHRYDIIFIYREGFMTGSVFFEKIFKKSGAKIILDFDDAIWLPAISEANKSLKWLKRPEKINEIIALSDLVVVGNKYLAEYSLQFNKNTVVFPSTIDLNYYQLPRDNEKKPGRNNITIGWSGSHTTIEHFETLLPVLHELKRKFGNRLAIEVYGDPQYRNDQLGIQGTAWSPETEVPVISSFDIGVMPLPDNEWTRGKCGMKGLQYMALEIPTIMSPVGVNSEIIQHGVNGYLASSQDEYVYILSQLIEDASLRQRIGQAGRKTIEDHYSVKAWQGKYLQYFEELTA